MIESTKSKDILFALCHNCFIERSSKQIHFYIRFENSKSSIFAVFGKSDHGNLNYTVVQITVSFELPNYTESLNYTVILSCLQKLSNLTIAYFTAYSTETDFTFHRGMKIQNHSWCAAQSIRPRCWSSNSVIFNIGNVLRPNKTCYPRPCVHKETPKSLGGSDYQCPECASMCQLRIFLWKWNTPDSFEVGSKDLLFWSDSRVNSRRYCRCPLSC